MCEYISRWKLAMLELLHVDRLKVEEENSAAIMIYMWILALRSVRQGQFGFCTTCMTADEAKRLCR